MDERFDSTFTARSVPSPYRMCAPAQDAFSPCRSGGSRVLMKIAAACIVTRMNGDLPAIWQHLTGEESRIAQENLDRYLELAWEIYEELQQRTAEVDRNPRSPYDLEERSIPN